jgi:hypothetical protein
MAHHHQAQVAHGAAHDLQDIRGGQQPSTSLMAMPARNSINATRRAAPTHVSLFSSRHFTGTSVGAPLSLTKRTKNFAGLVVLAFRPTTCTSSGPS